MKKLIFLLFFTGLACAQTTTTNLGLTKPAHGAQNWDISLNSDLDILDQIFTLATCGDTSHAVSWNATTKALGCVAITGTAAAGGSNTNLQYNSSGALAGFADGTSTQVLHGGRTFSGVALADLSATGTPSSTTFLRGDNTWATPAGAGTVTSFSAGDLSPLFTTSEATVTTTPALTFSLSTALAHTFFGNNTGSTAAPGFQGITETDVTSLVSDLALKAPLAGPTFTGTVTLPANQALTTPVLGTPTSVTLTNGNGLPESGVTSLVSDLALLAPKASPTFTGVPAVPTAAPGTNTTQAASTAFVLANVGGGAVSSVFTRTGAIVATTGDYSVAQVTGAAPTASPTFTGVPAVPTAAVDTNTTQAASTAFVLAQSAAATPLIDGSAAVGTSTRFARGDHVHPTDTSRAALASPTFTGVPAGPTAAASTNTTQLATTAFVLANAGGTTINATNGRLPKRSTSTLFADSCLSDDGTTITNNCTGSILTPGLTTSGTNGGFDLLEGTGAGLTPATAHDIIWADSTAHRFKINDNNGGAGTLALFTDKLSVFAATTSAELAAVISDQTGTGLAVFNTSPTLVTPTLGVASATSVATTGTNGGFDGLEGTGAGLTPAASHDLFYADSTAHRWKMQNNNGSAVTVASLESPVFTAASLGASYLSGTNTAGSTGTTANLLVKIDTSGQVVNLAAADTIGALGVAVTTATSGNSVEVATRGKINCIADNTTVIGNILIVGTTTGGRCKDSGQTSTTSVTSTLQIVGKALTVATVGNPVSVQLYGPGHYGALTAGGGDALVANPLSQFASTTSAQLAGVLSNETGTGLAVFGTTPTLTTPVLGVATATSVNKMAITAPATSSTLAVADGKTLTASNTLTLAGTDGTTMTFPSASATITQTIASGTLALATSAIASAACTSAQTATATGTATTDVVSASFNGDPTAVTGFVPLTTGMLTIIMYPTTNTFNVKVCNNTSASITPGAITLNFRVAR